MFGFTEVILLSDNFGAPLIARIKKPERLIIDKPGIYYYGVLYTQQEKVYIQRQMNQQVIKAARKKYPKIFMQARPANF